MNKLTITKPCIFITSGGRTATRFLSEFLALSIQNCFSIHEPDVWRLDSLIEFQNASTICTQKIRDFGFLNMTIGKILPLGNPRGLSISRQKNQINKEEAARKLYQVRSRYIEQQKNIIYSECNLQLAGLIDIIPHVFPNSKTIFIIRDGREWVRSWFNGYFAHYGRRDPFYYITSGRANADMFPDDIFYGRWRTFTHFQKMCWLWRFHIEYALKTMKQNPHSQLVRYEDLFSSPDFESSMNGLLNYITKFPGGFEASYKYKGELSGVKFHESRHSQFPKWQEWKTRQVTDFQEICGELMTRQGYGSEPFWQEMTSKTLAA